MTVPLEVPVRCTCQQCGGRGETWTERARVAAAPAPSCCITSVQVTVPAGVIDGDRFHFTVDPRHHTPTRIELHVLVV